jgi:hypothetical protein
MKEKDKENMSSLNTKGKEGRRWQERRKGKNDSMRLLLAITEFPDFVHRLMPKIHSVSKTRSVSILSFRNIMLFRILDEREVQKLRNSECYTPSSEPFRIDMLVRTK